MSRAARAALHTPGDRLWAIARGLFGAHTTPAAIADAVARLWELITHPSASGDRDLTQLSEQLLLAAINHPYTRGPSCRR